MQIDIKYSTFHFLAVSTSIFRIEEYCNQYATTNGQVQFSIKDGLPPIVNTKNCFDDLLVAPDHVSRRPSDTYYATDTIVSPLLT